MIALIYMLTSRLTKIPSISENLADREPKDSIGLELSFLVLEHD